MVRKPSVTVVMTAEDRELEQSLEGAETRMKGLINPATAAFAAIAAGALAAAAAVKKVVEVLNEWEELTLAQQQAERQLTAVVLSTGQAAGFSADELIRYAAALQDVTNFADEDIIPAMAKLASFVDITGERFLRASETMLDMAVLFGSLDSAAVQLGKALNDPVKGINAMARSGVSFTEAEKEMIAALVEANDLIGAQNVILEALASQGMRNLARSTADASIQLENATSDLKEMGGELWKSFKEPWVEAAVDGISRSFGDLESASEDLNIEMKAVSSTLLTLVEDSMPAWKVMADVGVGTIENMAAKYKVLGWALRQAGGDVEALYEQEKKSLELDRALAEAQEKAAVETEKESKAIRDKQKAIEAAHKAADQAEQDFLAGRTGGVAMPTIELPSAEERAKGYVKAEERLQKARAALAAHLDQDTGFSAAIEDLASLNRRITTAAASRTVEDKQLAVLEKQLAEAEKQFKKEEELLTDINNNIARLAGLSNAVSTFADGSTAVGGTGGV